MTGLAVGAGYGTVFPANDPGWENVPILDVKVGWSVRIHGHQYVVEDIDVRWLDNAKRIGMATIYGGPCGPDYVHAPGGRVFMYTGAVE